MVEWIYVNAFTGIYDELSLKISLIYKKQKIKTSKKTLSSINLHCRHSAKIKPETALSNIGVHPSIVLLSFEILSLDEALDTLLDKLRRWDESDAQLLRDLSNKIVVMQHLPGLHNSNNGSFDLVTTLLLHIGRDGSTTTIRGSRSISSSHCTCRSRGTRRTARCRFLHADKRHSNSSHLTRKVGIEGERIRIRCDGLTLGSFS